MRVINRKVILPVECLAFGAGLAGVALPPLIKPEPVWHNPAEQGPYQQRQREVLAAEGFLSDSLLSDEFSATVSVLGRGSQEFSAVVNSPDLDYVLHVSASGMDAVLACYVPSSGQVLLRPAKADALAEELVAEFPDVAPGAGVALSVPETDLRQAVNGTPPRRDVRRVLDVAALPRNGGGQIYAGYRDGIHGYRTSGNNYCTFYDTDQGRYLFSFTEEPGYDRYVNVAQGRRETMITKTNELLNQLQRRPDRDL
ncbi:ESX secretion-associated protein EspG [Amycolatopsis sp. NPDC059657]|uniref:ESX secretion-associated protein EspG n=1 Tax=Amycolatopsis sp. NPDC059657 TaxID=3346899 RepID=UPI00366EB9AA